MTKKQERLFDKIYSLTDFPIFQYWDSNNKEFVPRALNKLSTKFLRYLAIDLSELKELTVETISRTFLDATRYAYFGNASYEAIGHPEFNDYACCGGHGSIQEQFVCWALNRPVEDYRERKINGYSDELSKDSPVIVEFIKNSELLKLVSKKKNTKVKEK